MAAKDWKLTGAKLSSIRGVAGVNLTLGIATVLIGAGGRFLGGGKRLLIIEAFLVCRAHNLFYYSSFHITSDQDLNLVTFLST